MFIPAYTVLPFILMLGCIAILPIFFSHFWDKNSNKLVISLLLSLPVAVWLMVNSHGHALFATMVFDYTPFLILLGSLFVITGGIFIDGDIEAKPSINTLFLAIGAILASFIGTTGASMLLIRPLLNTNKERKYKVHTVLFFIGIVANCGGLLTPLGDPPLFMMYLRGAPFQWFFSMFPIWLFANASLLIIYFLVDKYFVSKEPKESLEKDKSQIKPIKIYGNLNFVFILGVILAVAFINDNTMPFIKNNEYYKFLREIVILSMAGLSLIFTSKKLRESNNFNWGPIVEVAYLFLGIFVTMIPCILYLESNASQLGVKTPAMFYYASGALSSFLDNTPTAVTFYSLAEGLIKTDLSFTGMNFVSGIPENLMRAICVGSVFFGANTYIGNGPNFMVKTIAEDNGVKMPHFFEYMYKFSLIILLPLYILIQLLFI
jgi:Na+/H+ antiporter NhaD/arsenite permease-like protein